LRVFEMGTARRIGALVVVVCVGALCLAAAAGAASWSGRTLSAANSLRLPLFGISCPTASLCVAVGGGNTIASSTNPTGGADSWRVVYPGAGQAEPNQDQIRGVSCPSPGLCVAVTFLGQIYTSREPNGNAGSWQIADLTPEGPNLHFYGISCPTVDFCAASAGGAIVATSTNPTGGAGAWTLTHLQAPMELRGISCTSPALCVAVGDNGETARPEETAEGLIATSTNPLAGFWSTTLEPGRGALFGVSCPSAGLCVSGDALGNLLVTTAPGEGSAAWRQIGGGGSVQITDVDCTSPALCLAVDNNGDVLASEDPAGAPADWSFANIAPYPEPIGTAGNAFFGASCPTPALCAVAATGGQIFTGTDPFAGQASPLTATGGAKKQRRPRSKRPLVNLAKTPTTGIELRKGKWVTVRYRFFARHHAQVRGFLCKLDRRPLRACRSPKAYRVGVGRHVFRIRAIGYTGLRGPVQVNRFQVCHPTPYPQCATHLPPPTPPAGAR